MSESNASTIDLNQNVEENENNLEKKSESFIKTKIQTAKEAFLEWSSRTDLNNNGKIFEYKGNILAQIIWIIIFLVLGGLTVLIIQQSIDAYLSYSVTSTYETIYESPSEFPTITICGGNPFVTRESGNLFKEIAFSYNLGPS